MIKAGIIGFGKMGEIRAKSFEECGGEVSIVYEYDKDIFVEGYTRVDTVEDIFNSDVDAIYVCTPNNFNKEYVIRGLESGKHVFCEKPPAFTPEEVEEIMEVESKTDKKLMYGLNHRHHESVRYMREIVSSGELGKVIWMRGRYGKNVDKDFFKGWRANKEMSGGGILIDQGIHMLDLFMYMTDDFDEVQATVSNNYWNIDGIEDNVFAILKNRDNGITASLHSTMTQWRHLFSFEVFLEKGYMTLNGLKTSSGAYGNEILTVAKDKKSASPIRLSEKQFEYDTNNSWDSEAKYFINAIEKDIPIGIGNSYDALKVMRVIDKIYKFRDEKTDI